MHRVSIARSLRLTLIALTLGLTLLAAIGVRSLYSARQQYESTLANSAALAAGGANLLAAGAVEEEALRAPPGAAGDAARTAANHQYEVTSKAVIRLAASDPQSAQLVSEQLTAQAQAAELATHHGLAAAASPGGPLARARGLASTLQSRQQVRQRNARTRAQAITHHDVTFVAVAAVLALTTAIAAITLIIGSMRRPLDALVKATGRLAAGDHPDPVVPAGPRELRELGTAFNAMSADLARLEQAKTDFVATASHELRSPLTSIKGFVELLAGSTGLSARQREFVEIIHSSTDRLVDLVDDLLDVARIEADRFELDLRAIDVGQEVHEVARLMGARVASKGQRLGVHVDPSLPRALADPLRIRQILANLLTNAHLYTPDGGTIDVSAKPRDRWVELVVSDDGPGMSAAAAERAFERFYRGEQDGNRVVGTGLGLSIVKSLVDLHGGEIELDSKPGRGTTLKIRLPTTIVPAGSARPATLSQRWQ